MWAPVHGSSKVHWADMLKAAPGGKGNFLIKFSSCFLGKALLTNCPSEASLQFLKESSFLIILWGLLPLDVGNENMSTLECADFPDHFLLLND